MPVKHIYGKRSLQPLMSSDLKYRCTYNLTHGHEIQSLYSTYLHEMKPRGWIITDVQIKLSRYRLISKILKHWTVFLVLQKNTSVLSDSLSSKTNPIHAVIAWYFCKNTTKTTILFFICHKLSLINVCVSKIKCKF